MRIFPIPNDPTNKWVSYPELSEVKFSGKDSVFVKQILPIISKPCKNLKKSNDYTASEELLGRNRKISKKFGSRSISKRE